MTALDRVRRNMLVPHNRLLAARMRDSKRWVAAYREAAWHAAFAEAKTRSFFGNMLFALSRIATYRLESKS